MILDSKRDWKAAPNPVSGYRTDCLARIGELRLSRLCPAAEELADSRPLRFAALPALGGLGVEVAITPAPGHRPNCHQRRRGCGVSCSTVAPCSTVSPRGGAMRATSSARRVCSAASGGEESESLRDSEDDESAHVRSKMGAGPGACIEAKGLLRYWGD